MDVQLPEGFLQGIKAFLLLLDRWNLTHALTSLQPSERMEELIIDSTALLPHLEALRPGARVVDFGSGMGIPAVPLALARPDLDLRAMDKSRKKMAFLRQVALELPLPNLTVLIGRAEDLPPQQAEAGVAKAVGSLQLLTSWWLRHGQPGAPLWALKGPATGFEAVPDSWDCEAFPYHLPTRGARQILQLRKP